MTRLSETFSADGDSQIYAVRSGGHASAETVGFVLAGDFDGGTMIASYAADKGLPFGPIPDASWTDDVGDKLEFPPGARFKFTLASSTSPTITLDLRGFITDKTGS